MRSMKSSTVPPSDTHYTTDSDVNHQFDQVCECHRIVGNAPRVEKHSFRVAVMIVLRRLNAPRSRAPNRSPRPSTSKASGSVSTPFGNNPRTDGASMILKCGRAMAASPVCAESKSELIFSKPTAGYVPLVIPKHQRGHKLISGYEAAWERRSGAVEEQFRPTLLAITSVRSPSRTLFCE